MKIVDPRCALWLMLTILPAFVFAQPMANRVPKGDLRETLIESKSLACGDMVFSLQVINNGSGCCYRLLADNSNPDNCYMNIGLTLSAGEFTNFTHLSGWQHNTGGPAEYTVRPFFGFVPFGSNMIAEFCVEGAPSPTLTLQWNDLCSMEGCTADFVVNACFDPGNASIIGVKYRECSSLPYSNQATIPGWTMQLYNDAGDLIDEQVTGVDGAYAFYDLSKGTYVVKEAQKLGWTANVPASGQTTVDLSVSEQEVRNFGNCPGCSCDSIYMDVVQLPFTSDTCAYSLKYSGGDLNMCYQNIRISLGSGSISTVMATTGWTAVQMDSQHVQLNYAGGFIPIGFHEPCTFRVSGASTQEITVSTVYNIGAGDVTCSRAFSFQCPLPSSPAPCCPAGSSFGNELVKNGDFQLGNQDFTNDYTYFSPGGPSMIGKYSVLTQSQVFTANSQWACSDHTLIGGNLIILDGYAGPIAWQQTVTATAGTNYSYSAWVNNLVRPPKNYDDPQIALFVDNTQIAGPLNLPETPDQWVRLCGTWTATASGPVVLSIRMLATTVVGNDVAIDDISFRACVPPAPCQVGINVTQNPDCTVTVCAVTTGPQPVAYQWCDGRTDACFTTPQTPCVPTTYCVTATCSDGSTSSATVVYTVQDVTPPKAVCNLGIGVDLGAACAFQVTPAFVDGGSTDNCGIQSMSVSPNTLAACTNTIVTLTVTDWCGNTSTCTMGIQTAESVPPIMTCPANTTIIGTVGPNGLCTAAYQPAKPPATDNCDPSVTVTNNAPAVFQQGPTTITWTATDDCGNQTTCTQMVTVQCNCDCPNNLVTNGGFENGTAGFPNAINQINQCSGWYAANNNPAANNTGDWYWDPSFPGYYLAPAQTALPAHCGQKYAGFFLNTCEGITTQLSQNIQQGCSYEVGFWWTPATTPTAPFSFYAVMSGGNCTMYHPSGTCSHSCNGDQHVIVNATPANVAGTWYYHSMTVVNAYPNVGYMTFTAAQGAPNENNYIFVDDVCVKKIVEPCSVTASIICYPENPIAYTAQATLGCGSLVTQVDWYFDGLGPNSSSNLNSILHPFTTIGWHTVCLVVTASNDGGSTICKDSICKEVFIDHVPPTKCEKVLVNWQKLRTEESLCCYELQVDNLEPNCFTQIDLTLNSGTFANASISLGWTVIGNLNSPQISLIPTSGFLPTGFFSPLALCNPGGTGPYNLTVNLVYGLPPSEEKCEKNFQFDCPDTPIDSCCLDYDLFCQNVMNAVSVTVDNANCKATLNIGTLPDCDYIQKIIWGDGTQNTGNFGSGSMPMHTYGQSGTYVIQYLALELNPHTGLICFEKLLTETIEVVCPDCCKDEQAFQIAASAVQISSVYGNCSISVNATNMNDCLRVTWNWGDGSPIEGPYPNNTPLSHTYSTYGLFVVSCTISEVNQFGVTCFTRSFSLPQRVECYVLCPDCEDNLVQNPGFFEGAIGGELGLNGASNNWTAAPTTTPDVSDGIFCCDAFGIQMFGSQDDGEAICQAINFDPNKTYSISFSAYYFQPASIAPYVQFGFYASNGCVNPFPTCAGCETMGISPQITDQNCATYTLPDWTPSNNYNTLIIKALNANLFPSLSFGRIDNICIQEVPKCVCGSFSDLYARPATGAPSIQLFCGDTYNFGCPKPGQSIPITGKFECQGGNCPPSSQINWTLTGPNNFIINGSVQASPYFYLPISPLSYTQSGTYTLVLKGNCGGTDCPPCVIHFTVDCPNPCPCDVPQFQKDVDKGFATALWTTSCKGCFSPIAMNDCDMVSWSINGGPVIAVTNGSQSFCHTFPSAGTYTVTMIVSRKKSDGSPCETFTFSKSVNVTCVAIPVCSSSVFNNADFDEGAVEGGLASGTGMSTGWKRVWGDPHVEQKDGRWIINLTGHADSADVLSTLESRCLDKGSGMLRLKARIAESIGPPRRFAVFFNRGDSYVFNVFNSENCYRIADLDVTAYDSSWFDLEIPYNLSTWAALDSCGDVPHGVFVKPILYPYTGFEISQGIETGNTMEIDYLCFEHTLVSVNNPSLTGSLRIFPNPSNGIFTIELPQPAKPGTMFRIADLTGRLVQEQKTEPGSAQQTVRAGDLPAGLYFLQVVSEGKVLAVEKFVKQ